MPNFRYVPDIKATGEMLRNKVDDPMLFQVIQQLLDRDQQLEDVISTLDITARVIAWAAPLTAAVPRGWLYCNGQAVSRSAYANLFHNIGTTYGSGDGSTTFNVPNLTLGRTIAGYEASLTNFDAIGETGGSIASNMPSHSHNGDTLADGAFNVGHDQNHGQTGATEPPNHGHVFGTGTVSADHGHGVNAVVFMNCSATHGHAGGCGQLAESPSFGGCTGFGCGGSTGGINTNHTHGGTTAGVNTGLNHSHTGPPGHSNHSVGSHTHLIEAEGGVGNNLPPYITMRYLIRI